MNENDPQYRHLGELLSLMREEMHRGFAGLKDDLAARVSVDVYAAEQRLIEQRLGELAGDVAELRTETERAEQQRENDRRTDDERRAADRRMVWAAILGAGLSLAVALLSAALLS
ncbi:hypothetical protein ACIRPH_29910 [Nocardiopsis sp. NPDC101807]|uniref:hypothetical protein n=1 Tax=Nocardiopsis sp. NPDC101807 TaxID=3364339 RepID=UPI0038205CDE